MSANALRGPTVGSVARRPGVNAYGLTVIMYTTSLGPVFNGTLSNSDLFDTMSYEAVKLSTFSGERVNCVSCIFSWHGSCPRAQQCELDHLIFHRFPAILIEESPTLRLKIASGPKLAQLGGLFPLGPDTATIADDTQNATGAPTLCSLLRRLSRFSCRLTSRVGLDLGGGCLDRLRVHGRVELVGEGDEAAQGCA